MLTSFFQKGCFKHKSILLAFCKMNNGYKVGKHGPLNAKLNSYISKPGFWTTIARER